MHSVARRLVRSASFSRRFLNRESRREIIRFIMEHQNPDGGFRGRGEQSDLYYTVFAVAGLKALGRLPPFLRLWKYVRSFGSGKDLDLVHLVCLVRLRSVFPMSRAFRNQLLKQVELHQSESAYDLFIKLLGEDHLAEPHFPDEELSLIPNATTTNVAAAIVVNRRASSMDRTLLMDRLCESGGFAPNGQINNPDLLSTATALFALNSVGADLNGIRQPCIEYVESLWRDSGGFCGHAEDGFEDVEYTFYALLCIGCAMDNVASHSRGRED